MKSEYGDIKLNTKDYIAWDNIEIETSALPRVLQLHSF